MGLQVNQPTSSRVLTSQHKRLRPSQVLPYLSFSLIAIALTLVTLRLYPPIYPGEFWGDHVFYWAQANSWLGLNEPLQMTNETESRFRQLQMEYYYQVENGTTSQPPYVYRVLVPILAGLLGLVMPLFTAFSMLSALSFFCIFLCVAVSVFKLSGSFVAGVASSALMATIPGFLSLSGQVAYVDIESIAIVSLCVTFLIFGHFGASLALAVLGSMAKETLVVLALCVVLIAVFQRSSKRWYWIFAAAPFVFQFLLRILVTVPAPPPISELFVPGNPFAGLYSFMDVYIMLIPVLIGLGGWYVRDYVLGFFPLWLSIFAVNSSSVAAGQRIWLTVAPVLIVFGVSGAWKAIRVASARWGWLLFVCIGGFLSVAPWLFGLTRAPQTVWLLLFGFAVVLVALLNVFTSSFVATKRSPTSSKVMVV